MLCSRCSAILRRFRNTTAEFLVGLCTLGIFAAGTLQGAPLRTVEELVEAAAVNGAVIELAAGTFRLSLPLELKAGTTLKGSGIGETVITHDAAWSARTDTLPDPETNQTKFDRSGYLVRLADRAEDIAISGITFTGPRMHGAIFGQANRGVHLHDLRIETFMAAGVRSYSWKGAKIHDCVFVDAGQRWAKGLPGIDGGITGGGIFAIWISDSEIWNNRFLRTRTAPNEHYYGIKGRQGKHLRIHHNTIETNFSVEFPFENDGDIELDHNVFHGTVSIPKHGGGAVPPSGRTFHLHHNLFKNSYAIEFVRNGVEIDHNFFDFDPAQDGGNLISGFGKEPASGPVDFHHNQVRNPGRGVIWISAPIARFDIHHNHIRASTTTTRREEGLFGFHPGSDFKTIRITDNVIECEGTPRPLVRNAASAAASVENNTLVGISDVSRYADQRTTVTSDDRVTLQFQCGVNGEMTVNGWHIPVRKQP